MDPLAQKIWPKPGDCRPIMGADYDLVRAQLAAAKEEIERLSVARCAAGIQSAIDAVLYAAVNDKHPQYTIRLAEDSEYEILDENENIVAAAESNIIAHAILRALNGNKLDANIVDLQGLEENCKTYLLQRNRYQDLVFDAYLEGAALGEVTESDAIRHWANSDAKAVMDDAEAN